MDALLSFCKENFQLICLLVGLLGVVIGIASVVYEMKRKKQQAKENKE